MIVNQIFGPEGEPIPFATIDIYKSDAEGREQGPHLVTVTADKTGVPPEIEISGVEYVRLVIKRGSEIISVIYNLKIGSGQSEKKP